MAILTFAHWFSLDLPLYTAVQRHFRHKRVELKTSLNWRAFRTSDLGFLSCLYGILKPSCIYAAAKMHRFLHSVINSVTFTSMIIMEIPVKKKSTTNNSFWENQWCRNQCCVVLQLGTVGSWTFLNTSPINRCTNVTKDSFQIVVSEFLQCDNLVFFPIAKPLLINTLTRFHLNSDSVIWAFTEEL